MAEYDADNLQSVLTYMRERFGEGIFEEPIRMYATMNDLSPKMKGARNILRHLSEAGLCAELRVAIRSGQDNECLRVLTKSRYWLINNLDLSEDRSEYYVTALKVAYGLETPSQPQMPSEPAPKIISAPNPAPPKPIPQQKPTPQPPKPIQQPKPTPQPSLPKSISQPEPQPKSKPTSKPMFAALRSLFAAVLKPQSKLAPIIKLGSSGDCTWTLDGNGTFTVSGNGTMENYSYFRDSPWKNDSNGIYSVIIEHGVTSIGSHAFQNCNSLTSVSIPDSVTSIGSQAFQNCSSLTSVSIPDSVTSIHVQAFSGCDSLTSVNIPDSATFIGNGAFEDCSSLTNVDVSSKNQSYCSLEGILFNKLKTSLCCYPAGKKISYSFYYAIPDGVTSIEDSAFSGCSNLTSVSIPDSVTSIGSHAFENCSGLRNVNIPNSVTFIGWRVFYGCNILTSVSIPAKANISAGAFDEHIKVTRRR